MSEVLDLSKEREKRKKQNYKRLDTFSLLEEGEQTGRYNSFFYCIENICDNVRIILAKKGIILTNDQYYLGTEDFRKNLLDKIIGDYERFPEDSSVKRVELYMAGYVKKFQNILEEQINKEMIVFTERYPNLGKGYFLKGIVRNFIKYHQYGNITESHIYIEYKWFIDDISMSYDVIVSTNKSTELIQKKLHRLRVVSIKKLHDMYE